MLLSMPKVFFTKGFPDRLLPLQTGGFSDLRQNRRLVKWQIRERQTALVFR